MAAQRSDCAVFRTWSAIVRRRAHFHPLKRIDGPLHWGIATDIGKRRRTRSPHK